MKIDDMQEEFKRILIYGYQRGNDNDTITTKELIGELSDLLRMMFEKYNDDSAVQ